MQDTLLSLQHITKNFGEGDVLRDISLDVARGEFVTLLGASGCGKTTTLRIISGLETPDEGTVLLAMVYCLISFMILPCHNAVDKMDFTLVEAARDLGANPVRAFFTITLPMTMPGILAGCVLVFVPSVGLFYLSDIMGGGLVLVGNLIRDQLLKVRDWNVGSAMSMILIVLSAGIYLLYRKVGGDDLGVM